MVMPAESPVLIGDEMRFYYGGFALSHDNHDNPCGIGLATTERDRLVGLGQTSTAPGYALTRPIMVKKDSRLVVNAVILPQGALRAELRDDNNRTIEHFGLDDCDVVATTGYEQSVTWKDKDIPAGELRIRFELNSAQLFTFDLRNLR